MTPPKWEMNPKGNLSAATSDAGITYYQWTCESMLSRVDFPDGTHNYFAYDGLLNRVRRDDSGGARLYTWAGQDLLLERDAGGDIVAAHAHGYTPIPGAGSLVASDIDGALSVYQSDHVGSATDVTDGNGDAQSQFGYWPFGQRLERLANSQPCEFGLSGKVWDAGAGLYHFMMRVHDPATAQFLSRDPVSGPPNYGYCARNPLNAVDPSGLEPLTLIGLLPEIIDEFIDPPLSFLDPPLEFIENLPGHLVMPGAFGNCPRNNGCIDSSDGWELDQGGEVSRLIFHPGSHVCYRRPNPGGIGGQQCCYDAAGALTDDSADLIWPPREGWPRLWRVPGHFIVDVVPSLPGAGGRHIIRTPRYIGRGMRWIGRLL